MCASVLTILAKTNRERGWGKFDEAGRPGHDPRMVSAFWRWIYGGKARSGNQFSTETEQTHRYTHIDIMFAQLTRRSVQTIASRRMASTYASPRPSSLKGVLFGFFAGVSITGFGCYYYLLDEYKTSSDAIISDILLLQKTIRNMEAHIRVLESSVEKKWMLFLAFFSKRDVLQHV